MDDIIIVAEHNSEIVKIKKEISSLFQTKDLGELNYILGMHVQRDRKEKTMYIDQESLIRHTIARYTNNISQKSKLLMQTGCVLLKNDGASNSEDTKSFQEMIGSLLYISCFTRPNISLAVNAISQFSSNPSTEHFDVTRRIINYLNRTVRAKLAIKPGTCREMHIYCDADWATSKLDYRSTSSFAIYIGNSLVMWNSKRQRCIALSTMKAEMIAMCEALKLAM